MAHGITINHVSVPARDIEESVRFYVDLLGPENCEPIPTPDFGVPVPVQWLRVGDRQLHLFVLDIPAALHYYHFAISATDARQFERIYERAKDGDFLESVSFGHHVYELPGGCAQMYLVDPADNMVEIDWKDASELSGPVTEDIQRIAERGEQSEESLRSSLFFERLRERGWSPSDAAGP